MKRRKPQIIDREATAGAGFLDPRSYIRKGKQFLFGVDMQRLRERVFERSKGYCEQRVNGIPGGRCQRNISWEMGDLHHEPSLNNGGDDSLEGVLFVCKKCHESRHGRTLRWTKPKKYLA